MKREFDDNLRALCARHTGRPLTVREIARETGGIVSEQYIGQIEKSALAKMRRRLMRLDKSLSVFQLSC